MPDIPLRAAIDVAYGDKTARAALVEFRKWPDARPVSTRTFAFEVKAPYVPGRFYLREMPCILGILKQENRRYDTIVIDGFVHLAPPAKGLGVRLAAWHFNIIQFDLDEVLWVFAQKEILDLVEKDVSRFRGESQQKDDITLVIVKLA